MISLSTIILSLAKFGSDLIYRLHLGGRCTVTLIIFLNHFRSRSNFLTDSHCVKSRMKIIFYLLGSVRLIKNLFTSNCPLLQEEPIEKVTISMISFSLEKCGSGKKQTIDFLRWINSHPLSTFILIGVGCNVQLIMGPKNIFVFKILIGTPNSHQRIHGF